MRLVPKWNGAFICGFASSDHDDWFPSVLFDLDQRGTDEYRRYEGYVSATSPVPRYAREGLCIALVYFLCGVIAQ